MAAVAMTLWEEEEEGGVGGGGLGQVQSRSEPTLTPPSTRMVETSNICRSCYLYLYSNKVYGRPILMRNNVEHYKVFCINYDESRGRKEGGGWRLLVRGETAGQVWPRVLNVLVAGWFL